MHNMLVLLVILVNTLKTEQVHRRDDKTREEARASIFEYIEVFYTRRRSHSAIGYEAPRHGATHLCHCTRGRGGYAPAI